MENTGLSNDINVYGAKYIEKVPISKKVFIYSERGFSAKGRNKPVGIVALLPSQIQEQISSTWTAPFQTSGDVSAKLESVLQSFGMSTKFSWMTYQTWQGTGPLSLTLTLEFRMFESAAKDVMMPVRALQALALPSEGGKFGTLIPPGPSLLPLIRKEANASVKRVKKESSEIGKVASSMVASLSDFAQNSPLVSGAKKFFKKIGSEGDSISIQVGNVLIMDRVVITDVSPVFGGVIAFDGYPTYASVNVTVQTVYTPTRNFMIRLIDNYIKISTMAIPNVPHGRPIEVKNTFRV